MHTFIRRVAAGIAVVGVFAAVPAFANPIDGSYTANIFPANDDSSLGPIDLGFNFNYYGNVYTATWVNNNGNMTFAGPQGAYTPFGLSGALGNPIIAAFFGDVWTNGNSALTTYEARAIGVGGNPTFGIEWAGVNYFADDTGSKTNTFELLVVSRPDIAVGDADIYFNYGSIQWETGTASGGTNGLGGACAVVGYSNGSGESGTNYEVPGSGVCGALIDGGANALQTASNDGVPGQYLFTVRSGVVTPVDVAVPAPGALALFGLGLVGLAAIRRRITG